MLLRNVTMNVIRFFFDRTTKGYRTMPSGWQGDPYYGRLGRELAINPAIVLQNRCGGYYLSYAIQRLYRGMHAQIGRTAV